MLGVSCAVSFAASLVDPAEHESWWACGGEPPPPAELPAHDPIDRACDVMIRVLIIFPRKKEKKRNS